MNCTDKIADWIITILWVLVLATVTVLWASTYSRSDASSMRNVTLVRAMYDFENPRELVAGQAVVQELVTSEEWERLCVDNEMRAINTYFKFKNSPTGVNIVKVYPHGVMYTLENENILSSIHWLLFTEETEIDKLDNIREYKVVCGGGSQGLYGFK